MKILIVADEELREIWDHWDSTGKKRLEGVRLILSAGDIRPEYLEFLVTMLNVPCLYIRGNHDSRYDERPPEGCLDIDGRICEIRLGQDSDTGSGAIRVAGLGGSMRYRKGSDMYSEREMSARVRRLMLRSKIGLAEGPDGRKLFSRELKDEDKGIDIFLTHAPCRGYGDMEDLAHTGFECFNRFLEEVKPSYHCYGHVHMSYGQFERTTEHPSGTCLINCCGMYILDI